MRGVHNSRQYTLNTVKSSACVVWGCAKNGTNVLGMAGRDVTPLPHGPGADRLAEAAARAERDKGAAVATH